MAERIRPFRLSLGCQFLKRIYPHSCSSSTKLLSSLFFRTLDGCIHDPFGLSASVRPHSALGRTFSLLTSALPRSALGRTFSLLASVLPHPMFGRKCSSRWWS